MAQSINLIPKEERREQQKRSIVKASSVFAVVIVVLVVGVSGYFWYRTNTLEEQIKQEEEKIQSYRTDINNLSEIEITARTLDAKYQILRDILQSRRQYSVLLTEFRKRVPPTVNVDDFTVDESRLNLGGEGDNYNSIARFIDTLSNQDYDQAEPGLEELFVDVTLNSVKLDSQDARVSYFIVTQFNDALIKEK